MPNNPERASRGGDVSGETLTDVEGAVGSPIEVAEASYDPGYGLGASLDEQGQTMADLKQGFSSYGPSIGEVEERSFRGRI